MNYIKMVEHNMITNCDINIDDIIRAGVILGPAESVLQGKMKRKKPNTHNKITKLTLPLSVSQQHKTITMYIDIFYVNQISFFLSKTGKLNFLSGTNLKSRSGREITNTIEQDLNKHEQRGFDITDIHGDNEFNIQSLRNFLQPINLHIYAKEENVGFIENAIKTIKERSHFVCHITPYRKYTFLMTQSLIKGIIDMLNFFP